MVPQMDPRTPCRLGKGSTNGALGGGGGGGGNFILTSPPAKRVPRPGRGNKQAFLSSRERSNVAESAAPEAEVTSRGPLPLLSEL